MARASALAHGGAAAQAQTSGSSASDQHVFGRQPVQLHGSRFANRRPAWCPQAVRAAEWSPPAPSVFTAASRRPETASLTPSTVMGCRSYPRRSEAGHGRQEVPFGVARGSDERVSGDENATPSTAARVRTPPVERRQHQAKEWRRHVDRCTSGPGCSGRRNARSTAPR